MPDLLSKLRGALYGGAIGDAMGAPVEGWPPQRIAERYPDHMLEAFLPLAAIGPKGNAKGAGRITDDTLMTEALIKAYQAKGDHLEAYDYAVLMFPLIRGKPTYVPEYQCEMDLWDRFSGPEQLPWLRLALNQDPRTAGVGNAVNCGVAMWVMPVGAANAGDPEGAYREALLLGAAHNSSFAVEAGAVMAACAAAAFGRGAQLEDVLTAATAVSKEGTHWAIVDVLAVVDPAAPLDAFIAAARKAFEPYDPAWRPAGVNPGMKQSNRGLPSRTASIEELPVALAALKWGGGDFRKTLRAGVFYGRDCDSIAGMACCLCGGSMGVEALPAALCHEVDSVSKRDFGAIAASFHETVQAILAKDRRRLEARQAAAQAK